MRDTPTHLVSLENAGVFRSGRWLVRDVDLDLHAGEIVTLIGPNGSGKSTTVKMALGLMPTDRGKAWHAPGITVGYVPQRLEIDWTLPLTVARFMTLTGPLSRGAAEKALARVGIAGLAGSEIRDLSGGEYQRALLARAIARRPRLLVLDEPVQNVDATGEIELYGLIAETRDELGCGVLMISHDLHVVMAATDRVICMNGHVCCHGTPTIVAGSEEYRALFGPRAAPALALYEHHHDHTHLPDGSTSPAGEHDHDDDREHRHP